MYRPSSSSLFGMGAVGPGGYPSVVRCLYHDDGSAVRSIYARDPQRYGKGGSSGTAPVCYRTPSGTASLHRPPTIPRGQNGSQCLSIYDLYGSRVCFRPVPTAMPMAPQEQEDPFTADETIPVETETTIIDTTPTQDTATPEQTFTNAAYDEPVVVDDVMPIDIAPEEIYAPLPEPKKHMDKKTLLIGGILAAVVVGGVAVAMTRKR